MIYLVSSERFRGFLSAPGRRAAACVAAGAPAAAAPQEPNWEEIGNLVSQREAQLARAAWVEHAQQRAREDRRGRQEQQQQQRWDMQQQQDIGAIRSQLRGQPEFANWIAGQIRSGTLLERYLNSWGRPEE